MALLLHRKKVAPSVKGICLIKIVNRSRMVHDANSVISVTIEHFFFAKSLVLGQSNFEHYVTAIEMTKNHLECILSYLLLTLDTDSKIVLSLKECKYF